MGSMLLLTFLTKYFRVLRIRENTGDIYIYVYSIKNSLEKVSDLSETLETLGTTGFSSDKPPKYFVRRLSDLSEVQPLWMQDPSIDFVRNLFFV